MSAATVYNWLLGILFSPASRLVAARRSASSDRIFIFRRPLRPQSPATRECRGSPIGGRLRGPAGYPSNSGAFPGAIVTSIAASASVSPSPVALRYASFRVQPLKNACGCCCLGRERNSQSSRAATSSSFGEISSLPPDELVFFRGKAQRGIVLAFWAITAFMWLGVVVSMALGNVRIGKGEEGDQITGKGSYVGSLFWSKDGKVVIQESA